MPSVHWAAGAAQGWAGQSLSLLFLGKDGSQLWFLPLGVGQGQVTWGSQVFEVGFVTGSVLGDPKDTPGGCRASPAL